MFPKFKVTEIYCMADDLCKEFALQQKKYMVENKNCKHRNKLNRMSDTEIMVILILFHSRGFRCFKHYYKEYVCKYLKGMFPQCVFYNRFVECVGWTDCTNVFLADPWSAERFVNLVRIISRM